MRKRYCGLPVSVIERVVATCQTCVMLKHEDWPGLDKITAARARDAHLPLVRYEQQPGAGLAVRKYVLWRLGVLKSDAQRKPGPRVSRETAAEIDFMIERLERTTAPRSVRAAS